MSKVFISYSHADLAWASKLADSLTRLHYEVFFDRQSLRAGDVWESRILQSLLDCAHLVVLWSKEAQLSQWVQKEQARFEMAWLGQPPTPGHVLTQILLDNTSAAYQKYQHISEILDGGGYTAGADRVPDDLWGKVIERLQDSLGQFSVPVTRAVVTVTREELEHGQVDFKWAPLGGRSLTSLLSDLEIQPGQLADTFYGSSREEWRPFGGEHTIQQILEAIKDQLNAIPGATPIRWEPVEAELFANDRARIEQAARKLTNTVSLIVIDPVALYSQTIRQLVQDDLQECFRNSHAVVAALPLFPLPKPPRTHQEMVKQVYRSLVDRFYGEFAGLDQALCSVFTPDDADIKRLVRASIRQLATAAEQPKNPFLGQSR
jgi:TIR domain